MTTQALFTPSSLLLPNSRLSNFFSLSSSSFICHPSPLIASPKPLATIKHSKPCFIHSFYNNDDNNSSSSSSSSNNNNNYNNNNGNNNNNSGGQDHKEDNLDPSSSSFSSSSSSSSQASTAPLSTTDALAILKRLDSFHQAQDPYDKLGFLRSLPSDLSRIREAGEVVLQARPELTVPSQLYNLVETSCSTEAALKKELLSMLDALPVAKTNYGSRPALIMDVNQMLSVREEARKVRDLVFGVWDELYKRRVVEGFSTAMPSLLQLRERERNLLARPKTKDELLAQWEQRTGGLGYDALAPKRGFPGQGFLTTIAIGIILTLLPGFVASLSGSVQAAIVTRQLTYAMLTLSFIDAVFLNGLFYESAYTALVPGYRQRVVCHEAGHFLLAYLYGCQLWGYTLGAWDSFQAGVPGQGGTVFMDKELMRSFETADPSSSSSSPTIGIGMGVGVGRPVQRSLARSTIDRYSVVAMGGIAAEAEEFRQAKGGQSDENALIAMLSTVKPPFDYDQITTQAKWAVTEAVVAIQDQKKAYKALVQAMSQRKPLSDCILIIEENLDREKLAAYASYTPSTTSDTTETTLSSAPISPEAALLLERKRALEEELARINSKLTISSTNTIDQGSAPVQMTPDELEKKKAELRDRELDVEERMRQVEQRLKQLEADN